MFRSISKRFSPLFNLQQQQRRSMSIEAGIRQKLTDLLQPLELNITNDSAAHRHHAPMRAIDGGSGETHFTVRAVSTKFEGLNQMKRHRLIYGALKEELDAGLHALALQTKTPQEVGLAAPDEQPQKQQQADSTPTAE